MSTRIDDEVARIIANIEKSDLPLAVIATRAGVHRNTIRNLLRKRRCRVETLRRLEGVLAHDSRKSGRAA